MFVNVRKSVQKTLLPELHRFLDSSFFNDFLRPSVDMIFKLSGRYELNENVNLHNKDRGQFNLAITELNGWQNHHLNQKQIPCNHVFNLAITELNDWQNHHLNQKQIPCNHVFETVLYFIRCPCQQR